MGQKARYTRSGILTVVGVLIGLLPLVIFVSGPDYDYGVVLDAGSTGTRVHIYMWPHPVNSSFEPLVVEAPIYSESKWDFTVTPGISSFASHPQGAAACISPLLEYARELVPAAKRANTPIFLFATAGMRLVAEQNPAASEAILQSVRTIINSTGFLFQDPEQVRIITGQEEAAFGYALFCYNFYLCRSFFFPVTV